MGVIQSIRNLFLRTVNLTGYIDTEAAEKSIRNNIYFRGPNAWILAIAIIIASVGLNVNSIPVVIGAMLISPLMGPIFGLGLGLGVNDMELMKSSGKNLLTMVCISLTASICRHSGTKQKRKRNSILGSCHRHCIDASSMYSRIRNSERKTGIFSWRPLSVRHQLPVYHARNIYKREVLQIQTDRI